MPFSAAILAGGRSSRFGSDKALYCYQGKRFIDWVADSFQDAAECFLVANRDYPEVVLSRYEDVITGGGNMSGVHAALYHARYDWVAVAACDMPFLSASYWQQLYALRGSKALLMPYNAEGVLEPLACFYHKALLPELEKRLRENHDLRLRPLAQLGKSIRWERLDVPANTFKNINRRSDLP